MFFGEGQASLSFSHLNKDDEGLYTLRIVSRGGISEHSAFMFVRGTWLQVCKRHGEGASVRGWRDLRGGRSRHVYRAAHCLLAHLLTVMAVFLSCVHASTCLTISP